MAVDAARVVPTGLVLTVIGYCVWPYLVSSTPAPDDPPAAKPPQISVAALAPVIAPLPERDPFHAAGPSANGRSPTLLAGANGKGGSSDRRGTSAAGGAGARSPSIVVDPLQGLALEATSLSGQGRLAMINGHIYRQRETVQSPVAGAPPCVVAHVLADRVLLQSQGQTLELKYSNAGSSVPRKEPTAAGKRTGPTAGPRVRKSSARSSASNSH